MTIRFFFLLLLLPALAHSAPLLLGAERVTPHGHFEQLHDPAGTLTPEQALQANGWQPLREGVQSGFTRDVIWLRLTVQRAPTATPSWALRLSNAVLDDVRLYRPEPSGGWYEQRAGEDYPRDEWPLDYRSPVFPIALADSEPAVMLLRLQSKNALAVSFVLQPEADFDDFTRRESFYYGLYFGFCLLLVAFHIAFWRLTQAPDSGWYLTYLCTIESTTLLTAGIPQQLLRIPVWLSDPLLGASLAIGSLPVGAIFTMRQLQIQAIWPRLHRAVVGMALATGIVATAAIVAGHYGIGAPLAQIASLLLIPLFVGMALLLWRRGHKPARFFLLAFGLFYAGVVVSYLRNLSVLPANFWTDNATMLGTLTHMAIMSLRIISHYNQMKEERTQAQEQAIRATLNLAGRLEQEVALRTTELRAALANETRIREEQRDFVAMVSHEFRTPLAIIDTSAQQIGKNPTALPEKTQRRSQNIRDASARMLALVDAYLTEDRMDSSPNALRAARCPLHEFINDAVAEWPATRVIVDTAIPAFDLICDRGLLHVALRNLLANADRHTSADGLIRLRCVIDDAAAGTVHITVTNPCLTPIPVVERDRLFLKYYRGRQAQHSPGAGLGLYLVRRIARLHDGEAVLEQGGDGGVIVFRLSLPAYLATAAQPAVAPGR
jgi:signal transduction histidine kinase